MEIIKIEAGDKDLIADIVDYETVIFGDGGIGRWTIMPFIRYGEIYAAVHENEVISAVELMKAFDGEEVYIYGFFTKEKYSGKGYGSKLLEFTINEMRKNKVKVLSLTVDPENEAAKNLYFKHGFKEAGLLEDEYGEGVHRLYLKLFLDKEKQK